MDLFKTIEDELKKNKRVDLKFSNNEKGHIGKNKCLYQDTFRNGTVDYDYSLPILYKEYTDLFDSDTGYNKSDKSFSIRSIKVNNEWVFVPPVDKNTSPRCNLEDLVMSKPEGTVSVIFAFGGKAFVSNKTPNGEKTEDFILYWEDPISGKMTDLYAGKLNFYGPNLQCNDWSDIKGNIIAYQYNNNTVWTSLFMSKVEKLIFETFFNDRPATITTKDNKHCYLLKDSRDGINVSYSLAFSGENFREEIYAHMENYDPDTLKHKYDHNKDIVDVKYIESEKHIDRTKEPKDKDQDKSDISSNIKKLDPKEIKEVLKTGEKVVCYNRKGTKFPILYNEEKDLIYIKDRNFSVDILDNANFEHFKNDKEFEMIDLTCVAIDKGSWLDYIWMEPGSVDYNIKMQEEREKGKLVEGIGGELPSKQKTTETEKDKFINVCNLYATQWNPVTVFLEGGVGSYKAYKCGDNIFITTIAGAVDDPDSHIAVIGAYDEDLKHTTRPIYNIESYVYGTGEDIFCHSVKDKLTTVRKKKQNPQGQNKTTEKDLFNKLETETRTGERTKDLSRTLFSLIDIYISYELTFDEKKNITAELLENYFNSTSIKDDDERTKQFEDFASKIYERVSSNRIIVEEHKNKCDELLYALDSCLYKGEELVKQLIQLNKKFLYDTYCQEDIYKLVNKTIEEFKCNSTMDTTKEETKETLVWNEDYTSREIENNIPYLNDVVYRIEPDPTFNVTIQEEIWEHSVLQVNALLKHLVFKTKSNAEKRQKELMKILEEI